MAGSKQAIAIVLDVGASMNQAAPGNETSLETAIGGINMILQRQMFSESKDEVCLILFGTTDTDNPLADGDSYQNITLKRPLGIADFDLLQLVQDQLQPSDESGDFLDAIVVAMDHLETALQGKKGFASRQIILFTDLGSAFGDQELDTIVGALQNTKTELTVIGPNIDDDEEDRDEPRGARADGGGGGDAKQKTAQQKSGEQLVKHILDQVEGEHYSFNEALPALSYFQSRQVKPMAWKVNLEIGSIEIPVAGFSRVKEFKLKQSWKKVYAQDTSVAPGTLRTFHMQNEEETEVEKDEMVEGYRYGNTLVPMSEDDKDNMKYKAEKCLKVLGFAKMSHVKRHHFLSDGALSIAAQTGDAAASVALSAFINALFDLDMVAIARRVYAANSGPKLGCLIPHIKAKYECLYWIELPFAEDIRQFTFGSLPLTEDSVAVKKFQPTDEQLQCMDDLITGMDLTQALEDEDGDKQEALKPKLTFNPYFQRVYQCLQHRVLHPDDPIPDISPLVESYLHPPPSVVNASTSVIDRLKKICKLEIMEKQKDGKTGESMFKDDSESGPAAKKMKMDEDLSGGLQSIAKGEVKEVGTVTPTADFKALISRKDQDLFEEACQQMQGRIEQVVMDSFGQQFYAKALDCLKVLRLECVQKSEPGLYNSFLRTFKDTLIAKGRRDFWEVLVKESQALISKPECEESAVSKQEAEEFVADGGSAGQAEQPVEEDNTDDLLDEL